MLCEVAEQAKKHFIFNVMEASMGLSQVLIFAMSWREVD
jgi:hypothetical protein